MFYQKSMESGRSMVEMLCVLALMGFLSIIVLYGFDYIIYRYRVAQTLNQISTILAGSKTIQLNNIAASELKTDTAGNTFIPVKHVISDVKFKEDDPYRFITPLNAEVGVYQDPNGIWRVHIEYTDQMNFGDCRALLLSSLAENGVEYEQDHIVYTQEQLREDEELLKEICEYYTSSPQ